MSTYWHWTGWEHMAIGSAEDRDREGFLQLLLPFVFLFTTPTGRHTKEKMNWRRTAGMGGWMREGKGRMKRDDER